MGTRKVRRKVAKSFVAFHYTGDNLDGLRSFIEDDKGGMTMTEYPTKDGPKLYVEDHLFGYSHEVRADTFWVYNDPEMEMHDRDSFNEFYELVEENEQ